MHIICHVVVRVCGSVVRETEVRRSCMLHDVMHALVSHDRNVHVLYKCYWSFSLTRLGKFAGP